MYIESIIIVISGILFITFIGIIFVLCKKYTKTKTLLIIKKDLIQLQPYFKDDGVCNKIENVRGENNFYGVKDLGPAYECKLRESHRRFYIIKGLSFNDVLMSIHSTIREIDCLLDEIYGIISHGDYFERYILNDMLKRKNLM